MEITNEIKAKVFAQYFGQKVFRTNFEIKDNTQELTGYKLSCVLHGAPSQCVLILKPISAITDEDAIELVKIICPEAKNVFVSNGIINYDYDFLDINMDGEHDLKDIGNNCFPPCVYQYLQSKGYDLPHYLLNNKTLFESGLCTYETN